MRTKVTLVLLFLNIALFFFIFHFERDWRTERAALEVRRRVLGPEAADIRSLSVTGPASGAYRLEKRGDTWFLTQPLEWPAKADTVDRIVSELQSLEHETIFSVRDVLKNGQSLATYGLDHPKFVVKFTSGGPDTTGFAPITTTLEIGDITSDGQRLYVLSPDGAHIHVISRELAEVLAQTPKQLLADAVLTIPPYEARSLSLQPGGTASVRLRRDGSRWFFERPITAARADKAAVELAINGLDGLRVKDFLPANAAVPAPAAEPALRLTIEGDNRNETLFLGAAVDLGAGVAAGAGDREYYAQLDGRPAIFTVVLPSSLLKTLRNAQEDLRDPHVLDFDPAAVTSIVLNAPNLPELTLQRLEVPAGAADGAGWQLIGGGDPARGPQTLAADRAAVQRLLSQLALLSVASDATGAKKFESDAPSAADRETWGFNSPERQITLAVASLPPVSPIVLQIGQTTPPGNYAYALQPNLGSVYAVDPEILNETRVDPLAWRDRQVRHLPAGAKITALGLTDLKTGAVLLDWKAGEDAAPPVRSLLDELGDLRAQSFLSDHLTDGVKNLDGQDRPWRYRLDASISLLAGAGGEQTSTSMLWLTERIKGSLQLAGSKDFNVVFAVDQPVIDALWQLTYGARDPGPAPEPAAKAPNAAP
jgi:hypothetical protein